MADLIGFAPVWWSPETGQQPCTLAIAVVETVEDALGLGWWLSPLLRWPYTGVVVALPAGAVLRPLPLEEGGVAWLLDPAQAPEWRVMGQWPDPPTIRPG